MASNNEEEEDRSKIWAMIDKTFEKSMKHAEKAYRTNYYVNLIIVAIGIIFLGSSLYFSYTRGLDVSTLTFAGLGIVDFVALFLVNPQRRIQQLIGDLSQIVVISQTWKNQLQLVENCTWVPPDFKEAKILSLEDTKNINAEFARIAEEALNAIEKYIGTEPTKKPSQQSP